LHRCVAPASGNKDAARQALDEVVTREVEALLAAK
jgi:hypothetical protein